MGILEASSTIEVEAAVTRCYEIISDLENTPKWQEAMVSAEVLTKDSEGRAELVEIKSDAKVRTVTSHIAFEYQPETGMTWEQKKGDLKWLTGSWVLDELESGLTRATYALKADTGRMLGLLLKGPVEDRVKDLLTKDATSGLKKYAESG
jgi:ribosome-associated toxin RatA of RatAB toxin-antitoxin module